MYRDPKRLVGSQSEQPKACTTANHLIQVSGYQIYTISVPDGRIHYTHHHRKYDIIRNQMVVLRKKRCTSLCDLGCSNGLVMFLGARANYKQIVGLDHDPECVALITSLAKQTITRTADDVSFTAQQYTIQDGGSIPGGPYDVVVACALIHWIYSCTAGFGDLYKIIVFMAQATRRYLLIEWIAPNDPAIVSFQHTQYKAASAKTGYSVSLFEQALARAFSKGFRIVGSSSPTRVLYLAEK